MPAPVADSPAWTVQVGQIPGPDPGPGDPKQAGYLGVAVARPPVTVLLKYEAASPFICS